MFRYLLTFYLRAYMDSLYNRAEYIRNEMELASLFVGFEVGFITVYT